MFLNLLRAIIILIQKCVCVEGACYRIYSIIDYTTNLQKVKRTFPILHAPRIDASDSLTVDTLQFFLN